ncbi:lipopolysaccharide biosynthesis protein [Blastococcus sp. SYSU D00695]
MDPAPTTPQAGLRERATTSVLWAIAQRWSVQLSTLVGFIVLGRLLDPDDFGVVALAMTFVAVLTAVADAGYAAYLIRVKELTDRLAATAFTISTVVGAVLMLVVMALSGPLSDALGAPRLHLVLLFLAVPLFVTGLSSVPAALLERDLQFRALTIRQTLATGVSIVVAIVAAALGAGLWALVAQHLTRSVVAAVALWTATTFRPRREFSRSEARELTTFGLKSMGLAVSSQLRDQGELFLIGALAGTTALGYWTVAGRLVDAIFGLTTAAFFMVGVPLFAKLQDDPERLTRGLRTTMATGGMVLVPPLVFLALTSGTLVPLVFGEQWTASAGIAALLALRALASSCSGFLSVALASVGHPGTELLVSLGLLSVQVGLVLTLASHDLELLALLLALLSLVSWPVRAVVVRRLMGVTWRAYTDVLVVLLCGGLAAAVVFALQELTGITGWAELIVLGAVGGVVYVVALWFLRRPLLQQVLDVARRRGSTPRVEDEPTPGGTTAAAVEVAEASVAPDSPAPPAADGVPVRRAPDPTGR